MLHWELYIRLSLGQTSESPENLQPPSKLMKFLRISKTSDLRKIWYDQSTFYISRFSEFEVFEAFV